MAGRSGKYYRAGHWVNRSGGRARPAAKPLTTAAVLGLAAVVGFLVLISPDSTAQGPSTVPAATASAGVGH